MTRASCLIGCSLAACFAVQASAAVVFCGIPEVDGRGTFAVAVAITSEASVLQTPLSALRSEPAPEIRGDHRSVARDVVNGPSITADPSMWQLLPAITAPGVSMLDFSAALGTSRAAQASTARNAAEGSRGVIRY